MDELEQFKRTINLADFAASEGYALDRRESSHASLVMRHPDGDKIIVATDQDGHGVFFSVHGPASGSIIDFLQYRRGLNLGQVRKTLRAWLPAASAFPTGSKPPTLPKPAPAHRNRAALTAQWQGFAPYTGDYLARRGLTSATLAVATDWLRQDAYGNAAFRHDDAAGLTGWELKNSGFTGFAKGGTKALFAFRVGLEPDAAPPRVVVTESAIDALSFHQLDPAPGLLLSFAGSLSPDQERLLARLLASHSDATIIAATDNDAPGEAFAAFIRSRRPDTLRAIPLRGKDWNDAVRTEA